MLSHLQPLQLRINKCVWVHLRSSWHPHAAHPVAEAMRPEGGHVILLDLHLVALEVRELIQADLVLHAVLQGGNEGKVFKVTVCLYDISNS